MKTTTLRRRRNQRGNVFVETSLIFIVFFSMLIGAFDFGQFLFVHNALVERARWAARWGAVAGANGSTDTTSVQNMVLYNTSSAGTSGFLGLDSTMVSVTYTTSTTDNRVNVLIHDYPYTMVSPFIAGRHTGPNVSVTVPY